MIDILDILRYGYLLDILLISEPPEIANPMDKPIPKSMDYNLSFEVTSKKEKY